MDGQIYKRHEVFVVGGQPTVTYNPRPSRGLDEAVQQYLEERGRILCLTGPTKSGKTVLIRQAVPQSIRISGGEIASIDDFWCDIVDGLVAYTNETSELSRTEDEGTDDSLTASLKVGGSGIDVKRGDTASETVTARRSRGRTRDPRRVAKTELQTSKTVVVLDDFHHIIPDAQRQIVRGVKELVFDGVPFIFLAVPHRAADVLRVEKEMQGRVEQLRVTPWAPDELEDIAQKGFAALNINTPPSISSRMASESYGSPHLMQNFCLRICKANNITESLPDVVEMLGIAGDEFFKLPPAKPPAQLAPPNWPFGSEEGLLR